MILIISFSVIVTGMLGFLLWNKGRKGIFVKDFIEADAIVLSMYLTGISIKEEIEAVIQLQVQPELGKSFVGETKMMLSIADYMKVHPGIKIRTQYCTKNRKELSILKESFPGEPKPGLALSSSQSMMISK